MKGLPTANYREIDQSTVPPALLAGFHGVITPTLFGPTDKPYLVSTVDDLKSMFGGPDAVSSPYFAQLRRAIARGTALYIQRLLPADAAAALKADAVAKVTATAKSKGSWANGKLGYNYTKSGAGVDSKIEIIYTANTELNEVFTAATFDLLLAKVNAASKLVVLSTQAGYIEPVTTVATQYLAAGTDGAWGVDPAKENAAIALLANLSNVVNLDTISVLGIHTLTMYSALLAWAEAAQDTIALFEIDPNKTPAEAEAFARTIVTFSSFVAVYYGSWLTAYSVEDNADVAGGVIVDVQSVYSYSDTKAGNRLRAPAGGDRGLIPNVKSFKYNLLAPANKAQADRLVSLGVNLVGNHPQFGPAVWGANTMNQKDSSLDAVHVRRMLIDLHKQLAPVFGTILFDPMDPTTWRLAYGKVKPILANLEAERGVYAGWEYNGDQDASQMADARFNRPQDLAEGKYKVKISMTPVGFINNIDFTVTVNNLLALFQTAAS